MNLTPVVRVAWLALALLTISAAPLAAQNLLLTEYNGKFLPVIRAEGTRPLVEFEGKRVVAEGRRFSLHKVEEFLPVFISVRDLEVKTAYADMDGASVNHEFQLQARLETPYRLEDVFIVLELDTDTGGKVLFLHEVGQLKPREPKFISLQVLLTSGLGPGNYQMHLFSQGAEVLHSNIDPMYRESVLDHMTEKRVASVQDAPPKLFIGPQPEYPAALLKAKVSGKAVVSLRIGANGRVLGPALKSASDPTFGEAALAAVRMWRFLPQVKNGHPVETHADVPIDFDPPAEPVRKS